MNSNSSFLGCLLNKFRLSKNSLNKSGSSTLYEKLILSASSEMIPQPQSPPQEVPVNQSPVNSASSTNYRAFSSSSTLIDYDSDQTELGKSQLSATAATESPASPVNIREEKQNSAAQELVSMETEVEKEIQKEILSEVSKLKNPNKNNSETPEPETSTRAQLNPAVLTPAFIENIADTSIDELKSSISFQRDRIYSGEEVRAIMNVLQMAIKSKVTESVLQKKKKPKNNRIKEKDSPKNFEFDFDQLKSELKKQSNKKT